MQRPTAYHQGGRYAARRQKQKQRYLLLHTLRLNDVLSISQEAEDSCQCGDGASYLTKRCKFHENREPGASHR